MKLLLIFICIALASCTTEQQHAIVYTSHWSQSWQTYALEKCNNESQLLLIRIVEAKLAIGNDVTEADIKTLENLLLQSCIKYYNLSI